MTPEHWKRVGELFEAAVEHKPAARAEFLARVAAGDAALAEEVLRLLASDENAGTFLSNPPGLGSPESDGPFVARLELLREENPSLATDLKTLLQERHALGDERFLKTEDAVDAAGRGSTLGRYIVLTKLGGGGMGVVYAGYDPELDRKVAVKLLRSEKGERRTDPRGRERLLREAQAMARLSHPNVIAVYDVGTLGEQVFIAMELIDGPPLGKWLKEKQRGRHEVLDVFIQAGKGLAAAHAAGLVHRDFKPDNVLIGRDGQVKVLDFGLARAVEDLAAGAPTLPQQLKAQGDSTPRVLEVQLTKTGMFLGTPAYMAPEQLLGKATDARTDQFSFCVALHEALYGERPFDASSVEALTEKVIKGDVREPSKSSRVPGWARQILLRGLRPNPDERYPSMEALLRELSKDPRVARRRALAIGAALLGVVALGVGYRQAVYRHSQLCKGAEKKLAGVWDEQRKSALASAFLAIGKPYAQDAVRGVQRTLDAYARSWVGMHTEACEATRIRGDQSEELLDRRMSCLSERREELKSLVDLFLNADEKMVENGLKAASSLSGLEGCADIAALTGPLKPPTNAQTRAKVDELRQRLAQAKALEDAAKYSQALSLAVAIVDEAKPLHYRPFEAEALYQLGANQIGSHDYKNAASTSMEAVLAAQAGGNWRTAAAAWSRLTWLNGFLSRFEEAREYGKYALALIEHLGGDEKLLSLLYLDLGYVLDKEGKYDQALDYYERALKIGERIFDPSDLTVARSLERLGWVLTHLGKFDEAIASYQRAIRIDEEVLGSSHPTLATALGSLGNTLARQRKRDEALVVMRRALAIDESAWGPSDPRTATGRLNIANVLVHQGKYEGAVAELQGVLEIFGKTLGVESTQFGETLNGMADALRFQKKYNEALAYYERSLAVKEKLQGKTHPDLAHQLGGMGSSYMNLGQPRKAIDVLERAVALPTNARADPTRFANTRFLLARALSDLHREPARARKLALEAREAISAFTDGDAKSYWLKEIDTWLAKHPPKAAQ